MKKRRILKRNEGYTLVEMIIVIAIIAILSAAAMVTISIIHNAKAKEAASTLEDALFDTQNNAKGKVCMIGTTKYPDYKFALMVYKDGSKYYVKKCYYKGGGLSMSSADSYVTADNEKSGSGKGTSFSSYVDVKYVNPDGNEVAIGSGNDAVFIIYDRQGNCVRGSGKFKFYRSNKDVLLSTLVLNKNGSHTSD